MVSTEIPLAFPINGEPVAGTVLAGTSPDLLEAASFAGCNLVTGGRGLLDTGTEGGRFLLDNGIKVMYNIASPHIHGRPRLSQPISATDTEIPVDGQAPESEDQHVVIDEEIILYGMFDDGYLRDCERGAGSTEPAEHEPWKIIFWPGPLREDIEKVKSSPNLWGYWALDDNPGIARSAMAGLYRTVREVDHEPHPVCAGYTNIIALMNFAPGVCDMMMLYSYPISKRGFFRDRTTINTQWIMSHARRVVPGIPFVGIYQGFWGGQYQRDSPLSGGEIREQAEDYIREGSAGIMTFAILRPELGGGFHGWNEDRDMIKSIGEVNSEVRTGRFDVPPERETTSPRRIIAPGETSPTGEIPGIPLAWHILGPFEVGASTSLDTMYGPESGISPSHPGPDLEGRFEGKTGEISWQKTAAYTGSCVYSERWMGPLGDGSAALAYCAVSADHETEALMKMGCDVDMRVYIDGRVGYESVGNRGIAFDEEVKSVKLHAGENHLLVKTVNESGCWAFVLRFTDSDGRPLKGLNFSPS